MGLTLYHDDCLRRLPSLRAGSVALVLADLPYGTTKSPHDTPVDLGRLWPLLRRVTTPHAAILLFACQPFTTDLIVSNRREFRYDLVWRKDRGGASGFLNARKMPLRRHESICVFYRRPPVYHPQWEDGEPNHARGTGAAAARGAVYGGYAHVAADPEDRRKHPGSDLYFPAVPRAKRRHPQQKPWGLCAWLIRAYSNPGAVVLDCTMGAGSAGEACLRTGREFIGIEKDRDHFEATQEYLGQLAATLAVA
jgi:site-specific DNA-methyltransferase (adenine-specific)